MMMVKKKKRKNVEVLSLICRNVQMYWHSDESALRTQIRNTHTDTHSQRVKHRAQHMHTHSTYELCAVSILYSVGSLFYFPTFSSLHFVFGFLCVLRLHDTHTSGLRRNCESTGASFTSQYCVHLNSALQLQTKHEQPYICSTRV